MARILGFRRYALCPTVFLASVGYFRAVGSRDTITQVPTDTKQVGNGVVNPSRFLTEVRRLYFQQR